jgi:protocadherin-16/23
LIIFPFLYLQVNVSVLDVNDNKPQFAVSRITIPVKENVSPSVAIYQVYAIDKDSGDNGKVRYQLKQNPDNVFKINSVTGEITVQKVMDYETKKKYTLVIRAKDLGSQPQQADMTLVINVQDVNDNKPAFTEKDYKVVLKEDTAVNAKFKQLNATDRDTGNNARIIFKLGEPNKKFGIFPEDGYLYVKQALDREIQDQYILPVIAVDNGTPQLSAYTTVTIDLVDVNDNPPVFDNNRYDFRVNENGAPGSEVGTVIAKDADSGQNADIRYTFVASSPDFNINSKSGKITTKNILDREVQELFSVTVVARDRGTPILSSSVDVRIVVNDINDNSPSFVRSGNYVVEVWENRPKGTTVIQVTAMDIDKGTNGKVSYYLRK